MKNENINETTALEDMSDEEILQDILKDLQDMSVEDLMTSLKNCDDYGIDYFIESQKEWMKELKTVNQHSSPLKKE